MQILASQTCKAHPTQKADYCSRLFLLPVFLHPCYFSCCTFAIPGVMFDLHGRHFTAFWILGHGNSGSAWVGKARQREQLSQREQRRKYDRKKRIYRLCMHPMWTSSPPSTRWLSLHKSTLRMSVRRMGRGGVNGGGGAGPGQALSGLERLGRARQGGRGRLGAAGRAAARHGWARQGRQGLTTWGQE